MTLRAHICVVNPISMIMFSVLPILFLSCVPAPAHLEPKNQMKDTEPFTLDVSKKGRPDTWRWSTPDPADPKITLLREEIDLNADGKIDLWKEYRDGQVIELKMDLDFDGIVDQKEFYENGVILRTEISHNPTGTADTWRYYEKGSLVREETDKNKDGNPDEWSYFEANQLKRVAKDLNFDGVVDLWE